MKKLQKIIFSLVVLGMTLGSMNVGVINAAPNDMFTFDEATGTITKYLGTESHVDIPSEINGVEVKKIGVKAFAWNTNVTSVNIPNTVDEIGKEAFRGTGLVEIELPSSVRKVDFHSLSSSPSLEKVTIPNTVTELASSHLFDRAHGVKEMNFNANIEVLPGYTFFELGRDSGGVESLVLPETLKELTYGSLQAANTKHVRLGSQVEILGHYVFWKNQAKTVEIPSTVHTINELHSLRSSYIETYVLYSDEYLTNYEDYIDMFVKAGALYKNYRDVDIAKELVNIVIYDTEVSEGNSLVYELDQKETVQLSPEVKAGLLSIEGTQKGEVIETPEHVDLSSVDTSLVWSSADETIATVDNNGEVTGVKAGTTTITATSAWNSEKTVSYEITVKLGNYEVSFYDGDNEIKTEQTIEGSTVEVPETPTKESDDEYTYEFAGWVPQGNYSLEDLTSVSQDMKFVSSYKQIPLEVEEEDKEDDGEVLGEMIEKEEAKKEEVKKQTTHNQSTKVQTSDPTELGLYTMLFTILGISLVIYKRKFNH